MQLRIQAREDLPMATRAAVERRLRLTLGRHTAGIECAQVTLLPGEGRAASRCRIRIRLRDGESVAVEDRAEDPGAAAAGAAWRLEHRIRRRGAAAPVGALASRRRRSR